MRGYLRSFGFAFEGIWHAIRTQRNFKTHLVVSVVAVADGFYVGLAPVEWCVILLCIGLVLSAELFNTAFEVLGDGMSDGKWDGRVKLLKDISAAGVMVCVLASVGVGIVLLAVPAVQKIVALF